MKGGTTIEAAHGSARRWVGELTGRSGADLDRTMADGAVEGARVEAQEVIGKADIRAAGGMIHPGAPASVLRPAELRTLDAIADGHSTVTAAAALGLSPSTVQTTLKVARRRLKAKTTAHAIRLAIRDGQLPP